MRASEKTLRTWMIAGLDGDSSAHAALLRALVPVLRSYFQRRMRDGAEDAEDLVQEVLIAVHTRRATYDPTRSFTAWLFAIARYKLIDRFRTLRWHVPVEGLEEILRAEGFEESANARMDVDKLLDELPPKQARMIRATRIEGLSVAEAAETGGLGESDVKVSVHRGIKTLVARMRGDGR